MEGGVGSGNRVLIERGRENGLGMKGKVGIWEGVTMEGLDGGVCQGREDGERINGLMGRGEGVWDGREIGEAGLGRDGRKSDGGGKGKN